MKKILWLCLGAMFASLGLAKADDDSVDAFINMFAKDKAEVEAHALKRTVCFGANDPDPDCAPLKPAVHDLHVNFQLGSSILMQDAEKKLSRLATALKSTTLHDAHFEIDGHTDASGREDYNLDLSKRRAQSVVNYLVSRGVDHSRLEWKGFGQTQPAVGDPFAAENRRVEAHLAQ